MKTLRRQPLEAALCVILVAIVGVTFAQVVFRYLLQASLTWSEELARFLLLWLAALSRAFGIDGPAVGRARLAFPMMP